MKYLDGVMGVVIGDALGSPVQFRRRGELIVDRMIPCAHFNTPAGSWTDDSSLTLATLDSIQKCGKIDLKDIADKFAEWRYRGKYTPFGYAYDIGRTCDIAIREYNAFGILPSGQQDESSNGNGSLMRILPACIAAERVEDVEDVSAITHAHRRSQIGCGLYYFIVNEIVSSDVDLKDCLYNGLKHGFDHYQNDSQIHYYDRLRDLDAFADLSESNIRSTGYVVHTLEAAIWSLLNTDSFRDALLLAVNLGDDADSVGAVCGGLVGLYYGYDAIPIEWLDAIQKREWIESLCNV